MKDLTFIETVEQAVIHIQQYLINDFSHHEIIVSNAQLNAKLAQELRDYFKTASCGQESGKACKAASVNPTFLQPTTHKWFLHYAACPFDGYLPLPVKELINPQSDVVKFGIIAGYCRSELKKLLVGFRKRIDKIMFYFHPCDALHFCYGDLPYKFDLIDTSNLSDILGLANLLNAAGRKLLSDQSLLFTESMTWVNTAPTVAKYVQEVLCCPLNLTPTLYGLRLMDNVELGQETARSTCTMLAMTARLRWKRTLPFDRVPLALTPTLESSLQRLMEACSLNPSVTHSRSQLCGKVCHFYSPLTFCYVLSDLIHRGGIQKPSALISAFHSRLPPVFRQTFEVHLAWMEGRPVWRVQVSVPFSDDDQELFNRLCLVGTPLVRLVLIPTIDFLMLVPNSQLSVNRMADLSSTRNHFIDNVGVSIELKPSGLVDRVDFAFLLEDQSILQTYTGMVVESFKGLPAFAIGPFAHRQYLVEPFSSPFPWTLRGEAESTTAPSDALRLVGESCHETDDAFNIRFKVISSSDGSCAPPSGIQTNETQCPGGILS